MINVGVIGLGMMGQTHVDAYANAATPKSSPFQIAIPIACLEKSCAQPEMSRARRREAFDLANAKAYAEGMELINDKSVDMVDICLATPLHVEYAIAALKKGKHVMVEKPLARSGKDAKKLAKTAAKAKGLSRVCSSRRTARVSAPA